MTTLNQRIKTLRKEKGLTQNQLANKLGITDKAVSKWETEEANPDIALLVKLAELFNVTIDYLLTGKVEDKISIDDMDNEKRAFYLIKKDDELNFKKYGYIEKIIFIKPYAGYYDRKSQELFEAIYENKSKKIFKDCLESLLTYKKEHNISDTRFQSDINVDLDKYIRFCAEIDLVEGLKAINCKYFGVTDKTLINAVKFHVRDNRNNFYDEFVTSSVSKETLEWIFTLTKSKNVLNYLSKIEFFKESDNCVYLMTNNVLLELYKNKYFDLLNKAIEEMDKYNDYAKEILGHIVTWKLLY